MMTLMAVHLEVVFCLESGGGARMSYVMAQNTDWFQEQRACGSTMTKVANPIAHSDLLSRSLFCHP